MSPKKTVIYKKNYEGEFHKGFKSGEGKIYDDDGKVRF